MKLRRQKLRASSTLAERLMWTRLRNSQLGYKFFRQYSIEGYVIDFYCPKRRLGIELEGHIHDVVSVKAYDKYRKRYLEAYGIKLLIFTNEEIMANIKNVLNRLEVSLS